MQTIKLIGLWWWYLFFKERNSIIHLAEPFRARPIDEGASNVR